MSSVSSVSFGNSITVGCSHVARVRFRPEGSSLEGAVVRSSMGVCLAKFGNSGAASPTRADQTTRGCYVPNCGRCRQGSRRHALPDRSDGGATTTAERFHRADETSRQRILSPTLEPTYMAAALASLRSVSTRLHFPGRSPTLPVTQSPSPRNASARAPVGGPQSPGARLWPADRPALVCVQPPVYHQSKDR